MIRFPHGDRPLKRICFQIVGYYLQKCKFYYFRGQYALDLQFYALINKFAHYKLKLLKSTQICSNMHKYAGFTVK